MTENGYFSLAGVYDVLNDQIDYSKWADYIEDIIKKYAVHPTKLVLDLGCGTGKMTFEMRRRGYDMTGVDISPEMLAEAAEICRKEKIDDILWLCQDMTDFELYGTVDAALCCLDGINHLTRREDLSKCFSLVHNYLIPDGLFIFDVNSPHKFETVYGGNDYILEDDGVLFAWQNDYNPNTGLCTFFMSVFTEDGDGRYKRSDSIQRERKYSFRVLKNALENAGFELLFISGSYGYDKPKEDDERWYIAAKCIK